jgi:hypothetical protein
MSLSALATALKAARDTALKVDVGDYTGNMSIGRELGMDASMHDANMSLLAITEPAEYLALKNADLDEIKTNLEDQFKTTFSKYWATGMSQSKAKELATRVCENLQNSLMDLHDERFPSNAGAVQMKAFKKQAAHDKLKGQV